MAAEHPNFEDDKTQSVIAAAISSMIICVTFYSLRIISRLVSGSRMLWSDLFLFGGVIACVVISSVDLHGLKFGLGRQLAYVATKDPKLTGVVTMLKFLMVNNCVYAFGQVTVKISLCLLYRKIFTSSILHKVIDLTIVYSVAWGIAFVGVALFSCRPIHAFWDFTLQQLPTTYCINNRAWYAGQEVPNILTDILVLLMPMKQVWALKLDKRSKIVLIVTFAFGIFVCAISVVRVYSLFAIDNLDPTWTLVGIANWSSVEFAIAVMCCSLPTLGPLVNWTRPKSKSQPTPQYATETVGGGRRKMFSSKANQSSHLHGHFARLHGLEMGNDSFAMNDMETLVESRPGDEPKALDRITASTTVTISRP